MVILAVSRTRATPDRFAIMARIADFATHCRVTTGTGIKVIRDSQWFARPSRVDGAEHPRIIKGLFTLTGHRAVQAGVRRKPMNAADEILRLSRAIRGFSPYAMSALAAWLWAPDASRVLWTNATGAALLGAATPAALAEQTFDAENPSPPRSRASPARCRAGWPRLEKLRAIARERSPATARASRCPAADTAFW